MSQYLPTTPDVAPEPRCATTTTSELVDAAPTRGDKLRFVGDGGFYREVKRRVLEHFERTGRSTKGTLRMLVKTTVLLLWGGASYALLVFAATTWWHTALLCCSLVFAVAGVAFAIQHDGNHGAYSQRVIVNRLVGMTLDLLGASSYIWHWKHNIAHHTYTNLDGKDNDIDVPFGRLVPGQPHRRFHRYQQFYLWGVYSLFVVYWQLFEDFKQVAEARIAGTPFPRPRGWRLVQMIAGKALFFGWALVVPALFHPWWIVLLCYVAMSMVLSLILVLIFQLAHSVEETALPALPPDAREVPRAWAVHQVQATVDFARGNRLLSWYLGGLNFQIEHHLFPRICHVHYARIAGIVQTTCAEFGVRYTENESLLGAIASHFRWLRQMGRLPSG